MKAGNKYVAKCPFTTPNGTVIENFTGLEPWGKEIVIISWDEEEGIGELSSSKLCSDVQVFNCGDIILIEMHYDMVEENYEG